MINQFLLDVEQMRVAQRHYFKLVNHARKSKEPIDWQAATTALAKSKQLETKVDTLLLSLSKRNQSNQFINEV